MTTRFSVAVAVFATLLALAVIPSASAAEDTLVLDESAYWRFYLHGGRVKIFSPALAGEGEALLGKRTIERLEEKTQRALKEEGRTVEDWHTEVFYPSGYPNLRLLAQAKSSPPPADWTEPGFDEGDWTWCRKPFKMGKDVHLDGFTDQPFSIKTAFFRTHFLVPDPAKAGGPRLRLVYLSLIHI